MTYPRIGVGVVIRRGNDVLLVRRANVHGAGTWSTPGGALDPGERPETCALREAFEETGVVAERPRFLALTTDLFDAERHYLTVWIEADYASGDATPAADYEVSEVAWFDLRALPRPRFLSFENLVTGDSLPPNAWDALGAGRRTD